MNLLWASPSFNRHNRPFLNFGLNPLILYTIFTPVEHNEKAVHGTKEGGDKAEKQEGRTSYVRSATSPTVGHLYNPSASAFDQSLGVV